ncbi:hypothetical protein FIV00_14990 [Labrenzia sp. THAF82]|uniref:hypothetical protein n=1 Tax=Labrenzia sp. THAF82 TaxID=2587861 RepID=UPI001267B1CC|nr:hypothetical protein [Labrenzia sp. THAF82]QFT31796.1 hypothetical protein FIV00_14990 [Labrenzia sp. THAF82]
MKVKIVSGGTGRTTQVFDVQGVEIPGITRARVEFSPNELVLATLELSIVDCSVVAEAKFIGPNGKPIAKVIYIDGSEDTYGVVSE